MKNFIYILTFSIIFISNTLHAQWIRSGKPTDRFFCFEAIHDKGTGGTNLFSGSARGGVYLSTDYGTSWTTTSRGPTPYEFRGLAVIDTNLYAAAGPVFLSNNNGKIWTQTSLGDYGAQTIAVSDTNVFAGTYNLGIYRSSDKGKTWTSVNSGLTGNALKVTVLFVSGKNLFAGTWGGGALRSTDNGTSWTEINNGIAAYVHSYVDAPNNMGGTNLFAGTFFGEGVYLSTDYGESWTPVSSGMTIKNVRCLAVSPNGAGGSNLFAGTWEGGVFLSQDNGIHWIDFNDGLTDNSTVNGLFVFESDLFAGTDNGIWRRPLSDLSVNVEQINTNHTAGGFGLEQNYPNPFSSSTKIGYQIPTSEDVSLKVYDILGNEVSTLVNEKKPAGSYDVEFGAQGLPGGIYFYNLRAGNSVEIRKMTLLK